MSLKDFVAESNRIEGINYTQPYEIEAHERFLALLVITVESMEEFVQTVAKCPLRAAVGQNVFIGDHSPPPGGPNIRIALIKILSELGYPWDAHIAYEKLHPFMDGNGRSGRVLWAWGMQHLGADPFSLPFLHRFYYQTLSAHN